MDSTLMGVLVVAGAAALALVLRAASRGDESMSGPAPAAPADEPGPEETSAVADETLATAEGPESEFAVLSSEGWTFVPFGDGVRLWAPAGEGVDTAELLASREAPLSGAEPHRKAAAARPAVVLSAGDLVAARVVRGTAGEAPWCVETLGRDREFSSWSFESEEAARAARGMLAQRVIRAADDDAEAVSDAEFDEARHIAEETLRELATMPEVEPPEETK
jgi:hypothetical protein